VSAGPHETERQAIEVTRSTVTGPAAALSAEGNRRLLEEAYTAAGVTLGAYDHRILLWLAGWEPSTCAVIAGLIVRAYEAGAAGEPSPDQAVTAADRAALRAALVRVNERLDNAGSDMIDLARLLDAPPGKLAEGAAILTDPEWRDSR
jgi:hypothetical protein